MAKKYKCRVEYLESTGTQYIDTGIKGKNNLDFDYKCIFTNLDGTAQCVGGNWSGASTSSVSFYLGLIRTNGNFAYHYDGTSSPVVVMNTTVQGTPYSVKGHMWTSEQYMVINGTKSSVGTISSTFTSTLNMYLFGINNNGLSNPAYIKLYYCKIYDNGVLVRDFIPVLDNSGRPAMYDQVSGQLFYNQGSGNDFSYGRQIIPVEYLESTGTQYIDTGIKLNNNHSVELDYQLTQAVQNRKGLFGGLDTGGSKRFGALLSPSNNQLECGYGSGNEFYQLGLPDTNRHIIKQAKNLLYFDGSLVYTFNTATFTQSFNAPLGNFNYTNYNPASAKYYGFKIWDNDTLVRDFIPCIDENLTPFMFDKVHNTVYLNEGTGQFKVGSNVEKVWCGKKLRRKLALALATLKKPRKYYCEVEYLEGTGTQYIDTGIDYFADFEVGIKLQQSVSNKALGNGAFYCMQRISGSNPCWQFTNGGSSAAYNTQTLITEHHVMKWKDDKVYSDGVLLTDFTKNLNTPNRMYLYSCDGNNKYPNMIYFCKLWNPDNGELVRDFIPVLDWDMKPCMFDRVTEQFFYNQATSGDDFSYGREIHYVDYLESTGTQYIDTGFKANTTTTKYQTKITPADITTTQALFGSRNTLNIANTNNCEVFIYQSQFRMDWVNGDGSRGLFIPVAVDTPYEIEVTRGRGVVNGVVYTSTEHTSVNQDYNFLIGNFTNGSSTPFSGGFIGKLYYGKLYSNDVLVRDYIPAIDENGVGFMLDRVSHTIYDNAGTGAFGYSAREVEYLESDGARAIVAGVTVDDTCGYDVKWMALNANDTIILGTKGAGDSRWVLSGSNNPNVNLSWNTSSGGVGLGLNKIQTAQMNYLNDRKRILNDTPLSDITTTLSANASTYNVGIFGGYWGSGTISLYSTCRIYYAKITKGTNVIRDFVPMVKDGSPCLFDKIGGLYYFGSGTGSFTRGKIVEPEYD